MRKKILTPLAVLFLFLAAPVKAEDVTLDDFAWLSGHWVQDHGNGTTIEINWAPPIGPMMIGTWQYLEGDDLVAYRNLRIFKTGSEFYYRFDLYEKENNFERPKTTQLRVVSIEDGKVTFEGPFFGEESDAVLTIEITEAGALYGWAAERDALPEESILIYTATPTEN